VRLLVNNFTVLFTCTTETRWVFDWRRPSGAD